MACRRKGIQSRDSVYLRVTLMEQVLTMAAVNRSANFTITPPLVDAMAEEAAKLWKDDSTIEIYTSIGQVYSRCPKYCGEGV